MDLNGGLVTQNKLDLARCHMSKYMTSKR